MELPEDKRRLLVAAAWGTSLIFMIILLMLVIKDANAELKLVVAIIAFGTSLLARFAMRSRE